MSDKIRVDEWLQELERAMAAAGDEGMSVSEIAELAGHGPGWIRRRIGELHRQGRIMSGRANRPAIDGSMRPVPVYRLKPRASK